MAKRARTKANGEGSITYVKGRKSPWWARLPACYDETGKEIRPTLGFYKTKKEAEEALKSYNGIEDVKTLKEVFEKYKMSKEYQDFSKNNKNRYERAFEVFYPLHNKKIAKIKYSQYQFLVDRYIEEGRIVKINGVETREDYSKDHVRRLKIVLSKIYKLALKDGLVNRNLADLIEINGSKIKRKKKIFTTQEIEQLEESISTNPNARHILIMIFTGMRTGEYISLTNDKIDFDKNEITNFGIKTEAGQNRKMFIHPRIRKILMELSLESKSGAIVEYNDKPISYDSQFYDKIYYPALKEAGVKRKIPYSCRYTFATIAYMSGVDKKALQNLMGHTNFGITANSYIQNNGLDEFIYKELKKIQ